MIRTTMAVPEAGGSELIDLLNGVVKKTRPGQPGLVRELKIERGLPAALEPLHPAKSHCHR
jgi:hypothetical protein